MGFDFGRDVGGFVKHTIYEITESTREWYLVVPLLAIGMNFSRTASRLRQFAVPRQGGVVSSTVAKLPKQF